MKDLSTTCKPIRNPFKTELTITLTALKWIISTKIVCGTKPVTRKLVKSIKTEKGTQNLLNIRNKMIYRGKLKGLRTLKAQ